MWQQDVFDEDNAIVYADWIAYRLVLVQACSESRLLLFLIILNADSPMLMQLWKRITDWNFND